ncbi:MAG: HAMP domain-containing sensor histidine kinase [Candidatus Pacearchaeota archaeon]|jgi:signal transduction histidine kinase
MEQNEQLKQEIERLRMENEELRGVNANYDVMQQFAAHELKGPLANASGYLQLVEMELAKLRELHNFDVAGPEIKIRDYIERAEYNIDHILEERIALIMMKGLRPKDIAKNQKEINVSDKISSIINSSTHSILKKGLGLTFDYSQDVAEKLVYTNPFAFNTIFSNLISNSIKNSKENSVIKTMSYFTSQQFNFEIENLVNEPISQDFIKRFFEKGFEPKEIENGSFYMSSQGMGLKAIRDIVIETYGGKFNITSKNNFQITDKRAEGMLRKEFGIIPKSEYVPQLPSLNSKVSIPLEGLVK